MTWLRHAARHIHHGVHDYVAAHLDELGWTSPDPTVRPFGELSSQVVLWDVPALTEDGLVKGVANGVVACSIGDELPADMEELGGALASQEYPMYWDVFQDSDAVTLALASDIRDILMGRLPGTRRSLPLTNAATGAAVSGWHIELEEVERARPDRRVALHWHVVRATATAYFPEVQY